MTDIVERLDQLVDDRGEGRACCGLDYIDAAVDAAAEITRLRAKVAKADALAEASSYMLGRIYLYSGDHDDKLVLDGMKALADYRKAGT